MDVPRDVPSSVPKPILHTTREVGTLSGRVPSRCPGVAANPTRVGDDDLYLFHDTRNCPNNYLPLSMGWVLAPNDFGLIDWDSDCHPNGHDRDETYHAASSQWPNCDTDAKAIATMDTHSWSTSCVVLTDGTAWISGNNDGNNPGDDCGSQYLATSGSAYTTTGCNRRVLTRCRGL
eukprot:SAG31_NODE_480_length_15108_cov_56.073423_5_plen_176_part_00